MATYSDALMKPDMYREYRNSIDRYKPVSEIQKEMSKINLKYILHTYLRVRNLCDQGIDDPEDVADILNIPFYLADDLVNEYFLVPKALDQRTQVFSR